MADSEETAILEVSSENKTSISLKNDSRDSITDVSYYSTSVDGSVVRCCVIMFVCKTLRNIHDRLGVGYSCTLQFCK